MTASRIQPQARAERGRGEYDFSKLRVVLDNIIRTCSEMAGQTQASLWRPAKTND